jgi:hypothetical protein
LAPSSNAHTYRLLIVKELVWYCLLLVDKALCLSAAEKEEYEAFSSFRQLLFLLQHPFQGVPNSRQLLDFVNHFCGEANYSKRPESLQGFFGDVRATHGTKLAIA